MEKSLSPISNSIYLLLNPPPLTPSLLTITCHILPHEFKSYQLSAVFIGLSPTYSMLGGKGGGLTLWSLVAEGRLFPSRIFLSRNFPDFPRLLHFHDFHQDLRIFSWNIRWKELCPYFFLFLELVQHIRNNKVWQLCFFVLVRPGRAASAPRTRPRWRGSSGRPAWTCGYWRRVRCPTPPSPRAERKLTPHSLYPRTLTVELPQVYIGLNKAKSSHNSNKECWVKYSFFCTVNKKHT